MRWISRFVKRILGVYEPQFEYWVKTKDIKVPDNYKKIRLGKRNGNAREDTILGLENWNLRFYWIRISI